MTAESIFYLCPVCFETSEADRQDHCHRMIRCDAGEPGDERRKPLLNHHGDPESRAPRWFLEAVRSQQTAESAAR